METTYYGTSTAWGSGNGSGPWIMADMEAGFFPGTMQRRMMFRLLIHGDSYALLLMVAEVTNGIFVVAMHKKAVLQLFIVVFVPVHPQQCVLPNEQERSYSSWVMVVIMVTVRQALSTRE